jgi:hypothetical protein
MRENLYKKYQNFFETFEEKFISYFISLSLSYYKVYSKNELRLVAHKIYKEIFDMNLDISEEEEKLFYEMQQEGVMVGFFLNRTMFYFLEHFIHHIQEKELHLSRDIEEVVVHITHFIKHFETNICNNKADQSLHVNFDTNANIVIADNIVDILKQMKNENKIVKFFNLYKGVPISNDAKIVDVDGEEVVFQTNSIQEIAMKMDTHAYILKNEYFNKHIKADIVYNNFANSTVVLNNFTYLLNMPASQREYIRVHPNIFAVVKMAQGSNSDSMTTGKLFDLSVNGLGVVSEDNHGLYAGAKVEVSFELLIDKNIHRLDSIAEILNIIEYSDSYRYCMRIFPTPKEEEIIIQYVNIREKEIIANLENLLSDYQ